MKNFIVWVLITLILISGIGFYAEYCVSRPMDLGFTTAATVLLIVAVLLYGRFTIQLLTKYLKLKNK